MEIKTKYIIIAVIAIILIAAAIITVTVTKSKSNNNADNDSFIAEESGDRDVYEPVSMNDDIQVDFENINDSLAEEFENHNIETMFTTAYQPQPTTIADSTSKQNNGSTVKQPDSTTGKTESTTEKNMEKTTVKTETTTAAADIILKEIDSFFKGKYYFDGTMVSGGSSSPFEIAMNGNDFIVYSEMDGIDMGILSLDNKLYIINPADKKYTVLNSAVQNMMEIKPEDLKFDFNTTGFNGYTPTSVTQALYDGQPAVCYTYKNSKNCMDFVVVNNEIKQIIQYGENGEKLTVLQADEFTVDYSEDMVSLKDYKKTNLISFVAALMGGLN